MPEEVEKNEGAAPSGDDAPQDQRTMAMISWILSGLTPLVPIIIYLMKKDEGKFVKYHALQSLYFSLVSLVLTMITCGALWPVGLILGIVWGLKAKNGEYAAMPVVGGWVNVE